MRQSLEAILKAAHIGENTDWEFKSAAGGLPGSFWETYSAMANSEGGTIVLGAKETDAKVQLDGITVEQSERYKRDLWNNANNRGKVSLNLLSNEDVYTVPLKGAVLLVVNVRRATRNERPIYLNGQPIGNTYRRNHEGDYRCSDDIVRRMFADAEATSADHRILIGYSINDIDTPSLSQYRQRFKAAKGEHPWLGLDDLALLEKLGGWRVDRALGKSGLTLAGLLMFGKWDAIRDPEASPNFFPDYREKLDPTTRWNNRIYPDGTWEANLFQFYQRVWPHLVADIPVPFRLSGGQRRDETPVHEALREAFVNALIHADHSAPGGVVIERYPNRFVLSNPGLLLVSEEQFWQGGVSECRNKSLQLMFQMLGGGDKAGSGVDKIKEGWKSQQWRAPLLEIKEGPDRVSLTLLMVSLLPSETEEFLRTWLGQDRMAQLLPAELQALATAHIEGEVSNARLQKLLIDHPVDITRMLARLCEREWLISDDKKRWSRYKIPAKAQVSDQSSSIKPASSSIKPASSSIKPARSSIKQTNPSLWREMQELAAPLGKRTDPATVRATIYRLCTKNYLTFAELAELLNREPRGLRNVYISPMVAKGQLALKFPDKLNHPQQAYISINS